MNDGGGLIDFSLTKTEGMSPALIKTKELLDTLKSKELQLTLF